MKRLEELPAQQGREHEGLAVMNRNLMRLSEQLNEVYLRIARLESGTKHCGCPGDTLAGDDPHSLVNTCLPVQYCDD